MTAGEARSAWPVVAVAEAAVVGSAGGRCECRSVCGRAHAKGGGRCDVEHRQGRRLMIVPVDPEVRLDSVAAVRSAKRAMCPACWDLAHRIATRQAAEDRLATIEPLFAADLGGGAAAWPSCG